MLEFAFVAMCWGIFLCICGAGAVLIMFVIRVSTLVGYGCSLKSAAGKAKFEIFGAM